MPGRDAALPAAVGAARRPCHI